MRKVSASLFFAATALLTAAGCKYAGSSMQMDSNSSSPFFGLQWAVDSGSRPMMPQGNSNIPAAESQESTIPLRTDELKLLSPLDRLQRSLASDTSIATVSRQRETQLGCFLR